MSKFSERLKACMEEMDIKPSELSKLTGIDKSSISRYLKGDYVPKQLKVTILADALHVDPGWLFTGVKQEKVPNYANLKNVVPLELKKVPLLGTIAAGKPILCDEHIELLLPCDADLNADFALRVHGDSMIDVSYFDGDIVFIHQQPVVEDGQIAAVRIDDSATLKRFYKIPGGCMLLPENTKYKAMTFTSDNCDDIAIIGIPVAKYTKHVAQ